MWLATVFELSGARRAISWLVLPLASRVKISSSRSVRAARIATASLSLVVTGMSRCADALEKLAGDLGGEHGFAGCGRHDGAHDRLGWRVLQDVAGGAGDDRFDDPVLLAAGEHEDRVRRGRAGEAARSPRRPRCPGRRRSIRTTSGRTSTTISIASSPVCGLADELESASCKRVCESERISCSSSTRTTVMGRWRGTPSPCWAASRLILSGPPLAGIYPLARSDLR